MISLHFYIRFPPAFPFEQTSNCRRLDSKKQAKHFRNFYWMEQPTVCAPSIQLKWKLESGCKWVLSSFDVEWEAERSIIYWQMFDLMPLWMTSNWRATCFDCMKPWERTSYEIMLKPYDHIRESSLWIFDRDSPSPTLAIFHVVHELPRARLLEWLIENQQHHEARCK